MKWPLFLMMLLLSCKEDDPGPQMGCSTGIRKSTGNREVIRCCTQQDHLAGDNISQGGTDRFTLYLDHEWYEVSDCSECN